MYAYSKTKFEVQRFSLLFLFFSIRSKLYLKTPYLQDIVIALIKVLPLTMPIKKLVIKITIKKYSQTIHMICDVFVFEF